MAKSRVLLILSLALCFFARDLAAEDAKDKTLLPEEEDFSETPFTRYGEFQEDEDEEEDTRFLQSGRLFGVTLGLGLETADGNRGRLWNGGLPAFEIGLNYWFDFNWSLDLGVFFTSHNYLTDATNGERIDVGMSRYGVDLKYQLDTHNLAAPITFIAPFFLIGGHNYIKSERSAINNTADTTDTAFGFCLGAGMEFTLKPRRNYLQIEGKSHFVNFKDSNSNKFVSDGVNNIEDVRGRLYTFMIKFLFAW